MIIRKPKLHSRAKKLYVKGNLTYDEIGKKLNISRQRVHQIVKDYTPWKNRPKDFWRKNYRKRQIKNCYINLSLRFKLLEKYKYTCQYCGRKAPEAILQIDHIIPLSKGGNNNPINLTVACKECNIGKRDAILTEFSN